MANPLQEAAEKALSKLPYSLATMKLPPIVEAPAGGNPKMRAGVEDGNALSPIYIGDDKDFSNPDYTPQLLGHEMYHDKINNLPPTLRSQLPAGNANDPYNFGGTAGLKKVSGDPLKMSNEQGAAAMQNMIAAKQRGEKLDPIYNTFEQKFGALPLSVMEPTDPNQKGINTTPRAPGRPPESVWGAGNMLHVEKIIPVSPDSGDDAPDFIPATATDDAPDFIPAEQSKQTPPADSRNGLQKMVDTAAEPDTPQMRAKQTPLENGLSAFGKGFTRTIIKPLAHPVQSIEGVRDMAGETSGLNAMEGQSGPIAKMAQSERQKFSTEPLSQSIPDTLGEAAGMLTSGATMGAAGEAALPRIMDAGSAIRTAAIGDPDVAALRGLHVPANSPKTLSTLKSVEGARPYLQGTDSLQDLQTRIPQAKSEIWQPYQQAIDAIGKNPVKGPDGITTVGDLENERLQTSALLRGLKSRSPEAVQLAQQKGLTEAQLLSREQQIKSVLDPHLERAGVNPQEIRARFGNVAQVGSKVSGKSTLAEQPQPYGFGKMMDLKLDNPRSWFGSPMQGARDLVAGRPLWSGKPTDVSLREGFRMAGPKPNLGSYSPFAPKGLLNAPEPEFEHIPLGEVPNEMIESPMQVVRASRMSNENIVGGSPDPHNIEQLGNRATLPPARMTRRAFVTGTDEPINDIQRSGPGVLIRKKLPKE